MHLGSETLLFSLITLSESRAPGVVSVYDSDGTGNHRCRTNELNFQILNNIILVRWLRAFCGSGAKFRPHNNAVLPPKAPQSTNSNGIVCLLVKLFSCYVIVCFCVRGGQPSYIFCFIAKKRTYNPLQT